MLQYKIIKRPCAEAGFDLIGTFVVGMREMHHIVCIVFNRKDPASRKKARSLIRTLIQDTAKHGWGEYRTHLSVMDDVVGTCCLNNNAQM